MPQMFCDTYRHPNVAWSQLLLDLRTPPWILVLAVPSPPSPFFNDSEHKSGFSSSRKLSPIPQTSLRAIPPWTHLISSDSSDCSEGSWFVLPGPSVLASISAFISSFVACIPLHSTSCELPTFWYLLPSNVGIKKGMQTNHSVFLRWKESPTYEVLLICKVLCLVHEKPHRIVLFQICHKTAVIPNIIIIEVKTTAAPRSYM